MLLLQKKTPTLEIYLYNVMFEHQMIRIDTQKKKMGIFRDI